MRRSFIGFLAFSILLFSAFSVAAQDSFRAKNPDVDKYAFVKNFITGLGHYHHAADRLKKEADLVSATSSEASAIQAFIDNRTLDNTEFRIARNYLTHFSTSKNGLVRKVAQDTIATYDQLIALSMSERELWQSLYEFKIKDDSQRLDEEDFIRQQTELALDKKEAAKGLLQSSLLVRTILLSAEKCADENCHALAITQEERGRLIEKLDAFASNNMAWGAKVGQSTSEACEAAIREVLEDRLYSSR